MEDLGETVVNLALRIFMHLRHPVHIIMQSIASVGISSIRNLVFRSLKFSLMISTAAKLLILI